LLLGHGAATDLQANNGVTALIIAAQNGHTVIVDALLSAGADPTLRAMSGETALDIAKTEEIRRQLETASEPY